jgi:hypothetical protein
VARTIDDGTALDTLGNAGAAFNQPSGPAATPQALPLNFSSAAFAPTPARGR